MITCRYCRIAVIKSGFTMLEHVLLCHPIEALRDPGRLLGIAYDPTTQRALAAALKEKAIRAAARALRDKACIETGPKPSRRG